MIDNLKIYNFGEMELPQSILFKLLSYLSLHDAYIFSLTCKRILKIFESEFYWRYNFNAEKQIVCVSRIFNIKIQDIPDIAKCEIKSCNQRKINMINELKKLRLLLINNSNHVKINFNLNLQNLHTLVIANCKMRKFKGNFTLPNIASLTLTKNNIKKISKKLNYPTLRELHLMNNKLHNFPKKCNLPQMKYLNLRKNKFTKIPNLSHYINLMTLNLVQNKIEIAILNIPQQIRTLYLNKNKTAKHLNKNDYPDTLILT